MSEPDVIDLRKLALALLHRWWILLLALTVGGCAAFAVTTFFITPMYSATIKLYVNNTTESAKSISSADISASKSLVDTYIAIIRSDTMLDEVASETGDVYTASQLDSMLSAGALNNTEVFYITITSPSPEQSTQIANAIADVAPIHLSEIVDGSSVKIVDAAKIPTQPASPDVKKNTAMGALIGLFLSVGIIVLTVLFDVRIYTESDLQGITNLPILGSVTDFQTTDKS